MASKPPTTMRLPQHSSAQDQHVDSAASPSLSSFLRQQPAAVEQDEQEWVVFSPSVTVEPSNFTMTEMGTNMGHSMLWTEGTASGLSEIPGSSYLEGHGREDDEGEGEKDDEEEDEKHFLDLFRDNQSGHPVVLPAHDGRGIFASITSDESESIFMPEMASLEESLRLLAERNRMFDQTHDMHSRIQRWRQDHCAAFMEEMEKARDRKLRSKSPAHKPQSEVQWREEMEASMMFDEVDRENEPPLPWGQGEVNQVGRENTGVPETFWRKVTRSVMRDIMGIDDSVLEVIFGEPLPPSTSTAADSCTGEGVVGVKWERSLLERVARELGILLQQYTVHPTQGAFSTFPRHMMHSQDRIKDSNAGGAKTPRRGNSHDKVTEPNTCDNCVPMAVTSQSEVEFTPTLSHKLYDPIPRAHTGGKLAADSEYCSQRTAAGARTEAQLRKEYWEQELGVRVFFSYLKSRLSSSLSRSPSFRPLRKSTTIPTTTSPPSFEAHMPIYHQHPLLQCRYQPLKSSAGLSCTDKNPMGASLNILGLGGYRNGSSCASQSTRASNRVGKSKGSVGGSSAAAATSTLSKGFYWEVETSVSSAGGRTCVGAWGEI